MKSITLLFSLILLAGSGSGSMPVVCKPGMDAEPGLVNRNWMMQEIRFIQDNLDYQYRRGDDSFSNMNFDNDYIRFNPDGSGLYHQTDNKVYRLTWNYTDDAHSNILFTIDNFRYNSPLTVHWEHIKLEGNKIEYSEFYTHKTGIHSLGYGIRVAEKTTCPNGDASVARF